MAKPDILQTVDDAKAYADDAKQQVESHKEEDSTNAHQISNITNLQTELDAKEDTLNANQKIAIYEGVGEPDPSLGNDGDIYFQYEDDA